MSFIQPGSSLRKELLQTPHEGAAPPPMGVGEAVPKWSHESLLHSDVVTVLNMLSDVHMVTNDQAHTAQKKPLK